jgi:HK97 family phage prohead protease
MAERTTIMPYFISDQTDCPDWAVVKEDGSVVSCQDSKQSAIDQMVALSLAEELEPGGELRELPDNYRPALAEDVPEGRACGNCFFFDESRVNEAGDKAWCERWDDFVDGGFYCNAWEPDDSNDDDDADDREPIGRMRALADNLIARINNEESMTKDNKWLDVARAIALKIDGPQQESKEPEVRVNTTSFELRAEGDGMTFTGYASVFNSPSQDLGGFIEYVAPGAFKRSLQSRNEVKLLWNHDAGEPLASLRGGSMQLVEDDRGLKVTATLPQTSRGRDVAELLRTNVIDSMSFGFNVIKDTWSRDGQTRTLDSVRLFEVSIVSFPAYEATTAQVRSQPTINPDQLADALLKLESGEELDEPSATLITEVVNKLKANPAVEEVIDNGLDLLDLKKKQFDLLLKRI